MEGVKLLHSALEAGAPVEAVFVDDRARSNPDVSAVLDRALDQGARIFDLAPGVLERVADTVTPQPVLAVVGMPDASLDELGARDVRRGVRRRARPRQRRCGDPGGSRRGG